MVARIAWYENEGGSLPTFTERVISTTADGANSVFATDVDGDGDTDVLSASEFDDKIAWYESDGLLPPSFTERVISTTADGASSVFATDMDGDGDTDALSASMSGNRIAWYENDGLLPPSFTERVISIHANSVRSVFATDLDGDGDTDVLSGSFFGNIVAWHENSGGSPPTFTERVILTNKESGVSGAYSFFATDLDGDGDTDVLSGLTSNTIAWFESDGLLPPSFTQRVISTTANVPFSVFATDLDGDGDIDVVSALIGDEKVAWYENDGLSPPSFTEWLIWATDAPNSVFATDVDGDGDTDVLSASDAKGGDKVAWYQAFCGFDFDCNADVDLRDFSRFLEAITGPAPP